MTQEACFNVPLVDDLPVGIFTDHLAGAGCVKVAPLHLHAFPSRVVPVSVHFEIPVSAAQSSKMLRIAIGDVRQPLETCAQRFSHIRFALAPRAPLLFYPCISKTQSSQKNSMMRSRSCTLKASHRPVNVDRMSTRKSVVCRQPPSQPCRSKR